MKISTFLIVGLLWLPFSSVLAMDEITKHSFKEPLKVCVFCSADNKISEDYKIQAHDLGKELASIGATLITGGSNTGLMNEVVDGFTTKNQKDVYGVLPGALKPYNIVHPAIPEDHVIWTPDMYQRLATYHKLSNACIVLPGGYGTLHELMDYLVSDQFGIHKTTIILANLNGYWDHLLLLFRRMIDEKALSENHVKGLKIANSVEEIMVLLMEKGKEQSHNGLEDRFWETSSRHPL